MKTFEYTIKNPAGLHARPAGMLSRLTESFTSSIAIEKKGTSVNLSNLLAVMKLGAAQNESVRICINGDDEEKALECIKTFFEENM